MMAIWLLTCLGMTFVENDVLQLSRRAVFPAYNGLGPVAYSPDGTIIAIPGLREDIVFWDPKADKKLELQTSDWIDSLRVSHDSQLIVCGIAYNAVKVWDVRSRKLIQSFAWSKPTEELWQVTDVQFTKDNKEIICAAWHKSEGGQVFVGNLRTGKILKKVTFGAPWGVKTAFYPDVMQLVVAHGENISWWDMKGATFSKTVQAKEDLIMRLAVHPKGELLAGGHRRVFIVGADRKPRTTNIRSELVGIGEGGKTVVTYDTGSHELHIWDFETQERRQSIALSDDEDAVTMSPDGRQLVTARQRNLTVWDITKKGK